MKRLILDIDSVGDDILALLYCAKEKTLKLEGVTTVIGASGSIEQATKVALNTLYIANRQDIPVYKGAERPIVGHPKEVMEKPVKINEELKDIFGDRIKGFNPPAKKPNHKEQDKHAIDFIIETVMSNPNEISIVATGPLTNIGMAILQEPELSENIKECYIMGGVFKTPGNMTPVVEYNIWNDPEAAKIVFNSGVPITLIPLDICEDNSAADSMFTRDDIFDLSLMNNNKVASYIADFLPLYIDIWREYFKLVGFPMDDVIAAAVLVDDSLCKMTDRVYIDVETEGELTRGQCIAFFGNQILVKPKNKNTRICTSVDGLKFKNMFKYTISLYSN